MSPDLADAFNNTLYLPVLLLLSSYGEATPTESTSTGYGATTSAYGGAGQYGAI
jgi:hypothetical protein